MTPEESALMVRLDLDAIRSRYRRVAHTATTDRLIASASDVPELLSEVDRLAALLIETRMRHANLRAAVGAALSAARDGEPDPFVYLADELYGGWPITRSRR